jgi:ABC-type transport system substrate-binding protein
VPSVSFNLDQAQGIIQPNLAQSWEVSGGGKTYVFKLRKGVKFHNGQEMTAEDAKFAMDYTMNPKNGARGYERLDIVERVETLDKNTLKVTLKKISAALLSDLTEIQAFSDERAKYFKSDLPASASSELSASPILT